MDAIINLLHILFIQPIIKGHFGNSDGGTNTHGLKCARMNKTVCGGSSYAKNFCDFLDGVCPLPGEGIIRTAMVNTYSNLLSMTTAPCFKWYCSMVLFLNQKMNIREMAKPDGGWQPPTGISPRPMLMGAPRNALRAFNAGVSLAERRSWPSVMPHTDANWLNRSPKSSFPCGSWRAICWALLRSGSLSGCL